MRRRRTLFVDSDILVVGGGMSGCGAKGPQCHAAGIGECPPRMPRSSRYWGKPHPRMSRCRFGDYGIQSRRKDFQRHRMSSTSYRCRNFSRNRAMVS